MTYNHQLQGGYFQMPSARCGDEGEIAAGYSHVYPYRNYNLRCQMFERLEISGNYRIFSGLKDPVLSPLGFGDLSDKGANVKWTVLKPEDSACAFPGFAVGVDDFIGTRRFFSQYLVFTQVFTECNLEISLGYGRKRIHGFFGGFNFMPFRQALLQWLNSLSLSAEFDAINYRSEKKEPHPKGRRQRSSINYGVKYRLFDALDLSCSYIRGERFAFAASIFYNFGTSHGFLPKIDDKLPLKAPVNWEPLGEVRSDELFASELLFAFQEQGLTLLDIYLSNESCNAKRVTLHVLNETYWLEKELRCRLNHLLAALMPSDVDEVIIVIASEGVAIQQYLFRMEYVRLFASQLLSPYELNILTPMTDVEPILASYHLLKRNRPPFNFEILPRTNTLFGSSGGKFKYTLGLNVAINGFIFNDVYYSTLLGCNMFSNIKHSKGYDRLNPSQLIQVRSDIVKYYNQKGLLIDEAYLQKNSNWGSGIFTKVSAGYFEVEYGGIASEALYYPVQSRLAFGASCALLKKRSYKNLWLTNRIGKLQGVTLHHKKFLGSQYFFNLYYDIEELRLNCQFSLGKFLANDFGIKSALTHYFPSGLRMTMWYTWTNGKDKINGRTYHDKGIEFSLPFDIFYTYSERSRWTYGMSAWLRDVGVEANTGLKLYELINQQRQ